MCGQASSIRRRPSSAKRLIKLSAVIRDTPNALCVLVDGSCHQLRDLRVVARDYGVQVTIVLDFIHVCEDVWGTAWVFYREGDPAAEAWVRKRLLEILRGRSSLVAAGLRRSATRRGLSKQARAPLERCANYLLKNGAYLRYDEYLTAGLPIATGVIEGACRHLVKDRMELTGARWCLTGAEAVLRLRSLRSSGDFDQYWEFHLQQEHERHHRKRYAEGEIPELEASAKVDASNRRLRLVNDSIASL